MYKCLTKCFNKSKTDIIGSVHVVFVVYTDNDCPFIIIFDLIGQTR